MTSAPNPKKEINAFRATEFFVRVASEANERPDGDNVGNVLRPKLIARFAGGRELDVCRFDYNLGETGERIQDVHLLEEWNRQVDVRVPIPYDEPGGAGMIFWGETATSQTVINPNEETVSIEAVISPPLFGDIVRGMPLAVAKRDTDNQTDDDDDDDDAVDEIETMISEVDLVFNPIIDGRVVGNKSNKYDTSNRPEDNLFFSRDRDPGDDPNDFPLFISPDAVRTAAARADDDSEASLWTLADAVWLVLNLLNVDQEFIDNENPLAADWRALDRPNLSILEDAPPLINVRIPRGLYLPECLDRLLIPLGYNWFVVPGLSDKGDDPATPENEAELSARPAIKIYKRGEGIRKQVFFQRVGETVDLTESNAYDINIQWDILDLANAVTGHGSFIEKEMTVELYPCWPTDDDSLTPDELDPTVEGSQFHNGKENVWRRFAANEAGDWNGVRDRNESTKFDDDAFEEISRRRRRFFPCLTYRMNETEVEEKRLDPFVEYFNPTAGLSGTGAWLEVPSEWSYEILKDELGVLFNGRKIPAELVALGPSVRVRVTGVVIGDHRLESTSNIGGTSPNSHDVELFVDLSDKFHLRERVTSGNFRSRFSSNGLNEEPLNGDSPVTNRTADEVDDLGEMQDFLDALVEEEQAATMTAVITLQTIDQSYEIGDLIDTVEGRKLNLDRLVPGVAETRFAQITSIVHDVEAQVTKLKVESEGIPV